MKEEVVDDKVKKIFHWQRAHRRSRATEWIKKLLHTVIERESRLALSRTAHTYTRARMICITYAYLLTERCNGVCACCVCACVSCDSLRSRAIFGIYEGDCYIRDMSDRKRDCVGKTKGKNQGDIKWPGMKFLLWRLVQKSNAERCSCS